MKAIHQSSAFLVTRIIRGKSGERFFHPLGLESIETLLIIQRFQDTISKKNVNDPLFKGKHEFFRSSFLRLIVSEWKKRDYTISKSGNFLGFKRKLLQFFFFHSRNSIFDCHSFQNTVNPICSYNEDIEYSCYYLLHHLIDFNETLTFLNVTNGDDNDIETNDPFPHY